MLETIFGAGFVVLLLGSIYLYNELRKFQDSYERERRENAQKLFELTILNEVSDKIGYSLKPKDIAETISSTAGKILKVSAVSYSLFDEDQIEITSIAYENIGSPFTTAIKEIMLKSMIEIEPELRHLPAMHYTKQADPKKENNTLLNSSIHNDAVPQSYFNIPLVLNNKFSGMITIASRQKGAFLDNEMTMMYKVVNKAQHIIGKIELLTNTEKGKVESLVKSLSSGSMFFTLENDTLKLFTINSAAKRFLHITNDNADLIHVLAGFHLKPNIINEMKEVIQLKKSTIYRDIVIGELNFNIYVTPVFNLDTQKVIGVALTMQDVTRENELQKIREGFTNMMVHELRAPLTAIKGASELLVQSSTPEEDAIKMKLIIKNSAERLLHYIEDILESAKIDAGKLAIEKVQGSINEVVEKTSQELSYAAQNRGIVIQNHCDNQIPIFSFDPVRIGQVLTNLMSNAIKYSDEHTIIEISTAQKEGMVLVEVRDHGAGIEKEKIDKLFQPFAQAHFLKKTKGTGLGLYISKAIIEEHGGKIWLESELGKGTAAYFTLPIVVDPQAVQSMVPQKMHN